MWITVCYPRYLDASVSQFRHLFSNMPCVEMWQPRYPHPPFVDTTNRRAYYCLSSSSRAGSLASISDNKIYTRTSMVIPIDRPVIQFHIRFSYRTRGRSMAGCPDGGFVALLYWEDIERRGFENFRMRPFGGGYYCRNDAFDSRVPKCK